MKENLFERDMYEALAKREITIEEWVEHKKKTYGVMDPKYLKPHLLPTKAVESDDQGITLYTNAHSEYFIPWSEIDTPEKALFKVLHLSEKMWVNSWNIRAFIQLVGQKYKWGWYGEKADN